MGTRLIERHLYLIAPIFFCAVERLICSNETLIDLKSCGSMVATPMLTVIEMVLSSCTREIFATSSRSRSATIRAAAKSVPGRMTANSRSNASFQWRALLQPCGITLRVKEEQRYSRGAQTVPSREYLS